MRTKKIIKLLKEQDRFIKNGLVKCNCGRCVKMDNVTCIFPLDINYFDWWMYELNNDYTTTMKPKYWYGYIGYVPILHQIVYYSHKWFHKKKYILIIDCKYCENNK